MVAEIFRALGDQVRLTIIDRLSTDDRLWTIAEVTQGLPMSRQGARKHLQVLADAEIVRLEPRGRDVMVQLNTQKLRAANEHLAELERRWNLRLTALKVFVENS